MDKYFICLANSYKRGGRCIAGVEVVVSADNRWTLQCHTDGSPRWIRPIDRNTEYGEITEGDARFIPMYSVVRLTEVEPCPHQSHSEDVFFSQMLSVGKTQATDEVFRQFADNVHQEIFYSTELGISPEVYARGNYSLMLIRPERFQFVEDPTKNRAKYRMTFLYHGTEYDFSITDPIFYELVFQHREVVNELKNLYLTLSIGLEYEGRHHKLIAGVVIPSDTTSNADPYAIVREDNLQQVSTRPFTKAELATYKRAFIVPSQEGMSVCIKYKAGGDDFFFLDSECKAEPWQKVNLKKALLVLYKDSLGREIKRLKIPKTNRFPFFDRLRHLFRQMIP